MQGTLQQNAGRWVLRFERHYPHPPQKVWRALTEPSELEAWFPARIEGERRAGAKLQFVFDNNAAPTLEGVLRVFDPPHVLEYTWGNEVLRWELSAAGSGCRVVFENVFDERSKAARDAAGWHACLDGLEARLNEIGRGAGSGSAWPQRFAEYSQAFGLGEFPGFLRGALPADDELRELGIEGRRFASQSGDGDGDSQLSLLHATRAARTPELSGAGDAYLLVIEGSFSLHLGGLELPLRPGAEFHIPRGLVTTASVAAGTRWLLASPLQR
jgi:uncharacterized protein YndB with AHSA1/START domain